MTAIITGDIINSKQLESKIWLPLLKNILTKYGKSPKCWEIYRGDSFQLEVFIKDALKIAIIIKASIKQKASIDVRMAIGIGEKTYESDRITESNGTAFINSGECFESLKKDTLAIKTPFKQFDDQMNTMLPLALIVMDSWSVKSAETVKIALENPELNQMKLTKKLNKTQSSISEAFRRSAFDEIKKMISYYSKTIIELC